MTNTVPSTPDEEPTAELGRTIEPYETLMQPAEVKPAPEVDEVVRQLRAAGIEISRSAVRALALYAHRRRLDYHQVVVILARFTPARWDAATRAAAARLLADIGAGEISPARLEVDTADASGEARYHLELVRALAPELDRDSAPVRPVTSAQVLTEVARLCTEGLPVPYSTNIHSTAADEIWLTLHFANGDTAAVDAWVARLGGEPAAFEAAEYTSGGRRWRAYEVDRWGAQAEACWVPGVTRVHVWCASPSRPKPNDEEGRS